MVGIALHLAAQAPYVHVEEPGVAEVAVPSDPLEQLLLVTARPAASTSSVSSRSSVRVSRRSRPLRSARPCSGRISTFPRVSTRSAGGLARRSSAAIRVDSSPATRGLVT